MKLKKFFLAVTYVLRKLQPSIPQKGGENMKLDKKAEEALKAISPEKRSDILNSIGRQLVGKDLTQRQAEALLDAAKDLIKDVRL